MRPIVRGNAPTIPITEYRQAFKPLREQLGCYCSYCERPIPIHLAIEHIQSQSKHPLLALEWDNFLLACTNCNSCKGNNNGSRAGYLWPDQHNTLLAFSYASGIVRTALPASHPAHHLANALIGLVGLDRVPGLPGRKPSEADDRWNYRRQTVDSIQKSKQRLARCDTPEMREEIIERAKAVGGFSIWFEVFHDDADMRQRLIAAFPGTAADCFDAQARPIPKPGSII